jgi:flavin reductase (DIM6/NTAB) family NADH-FMN oxidoreductase RutF
MSSPLDQRTLRDAFGHFPSGVVAVAAEVDGVRSAMAASSFVSVSLEPALVAVCIGNQSSTWKRLAASKGIGISVLSEKHDESAVRALSAKTGDGFPGLVTTTSETGALFINGASVWLDTTVFQQVPAGDHIMVLLEITDLHVQNDVNPVVFHRSAFRTLAS